MGMLVWMMKLIRLVLMMMMMIVVMTLIMIVIGVDDEITFSWEMSSSCWREFGARPFGAENPLDRSLIIIKVAIGQKVMLKKTWPPRPPSPPAPLAERRHKTFSTFNMPFLFSLSDILKIVNIRWVFRFWWDEVVNTFNDIPLTHFTYRHLCTLLNI